MPRSHSFFLSALLLLLPSACTPPAPIPAGPSSLILLVRHAERADDGGMDPQMATDPQMVQDPPLSEAGQLRSSLLAEMLREAGITHIHSTDYRRTRETARPTSAATGVEVAIYDASKLEAFAAELLSSPGRHLVVGHSNTTHDLVTALGGDPGLPIESLEYDRLYLVSMEEGGVRTILLRFGASFPGSGDPEP
ncbi:MAG: histidine phosphatase family protein [Longimicrobiales bacterium]|nr:histidine phosphatase family protein [Longimicrobiales bacterium]